MLNMNCLLSLVCEGLDASRCCRGYWSILMRTYAVVLAKTRCSLAVADSVLRVPGIE